MNKLTLMFVLVAIFTPGWAISSSNPPRKDVYAIQCAACHGEAAEGLIGPSIRGTAWDVLVLKVTRGQYPQGYTPKRNTRSMPIFNLSRAQLEALYSWLN